MTNETNITDYPVFEKGIFKQHPALFNPYFRNIPDHLKQKYQKARKAMGRYEKSCTWNVIVGPGFCGSIHPGAGKVFHGAMTGAAHPVYTSDCLYVNTRQQVFAISDPPGVTTFSRDLITRLDERLQSNSAVGLEGMINEINQNAGTGLRDRATLALVHFPGDTPGQAMTLLCGDSYLFRGNKSRQTLSKMEAEPNRWGTLNARFELKSVTIEEDDFFILASDGITAIRLTEDSLRLEDILLKMVLDDAESFAKKVAGMSNQVVQEENAGQIRTTFGCGDDLSVILIEPEKLRADVSDGRHILGGYVERKTA